MLDQISFLFAFKLTYLVKPPKNSRRVERLMQTLTCWTPNLNPYLQNSQSSCSRTTKHPKYSRTHEQIWNNYQVRKELGWAHTRHLHLGCIRWLRLYRQPSCRQSRLDLLPWHRLRHILIDLVWVYFQGKFLVWLLVHRTTMLIVRNGGKGAITKL